MRARHAWILAAGALGTCAAAASYAPNRAKFVASPNATAARRRRDAAPETWFTVARRAARIVDAPSAGGRRKRLQVAAATDAEEAKLLPYLLAHARNLGIPATRLVIILHAPRDTRHYRAMASMVEEAGATGHVLWTSPYSGAAKEAVRRDVAFEWFRRRRLLRDGDWVVHADSDEFVHFGKTLKDVLDRAADAGADPGRNGSHRRRGHDVDRPWDSRLDPSSSRRGYDVDRPRGTGQPSR